MEREQKASQRRLEIKGERGLQKVETKRQKRAVQKGKKWGKVDSKQK